MSIGKMVKIGSCWKKVYHFNNNLFITWSAVHKIRNIRFLKLFNMFCKTKTVICLLHYITKHNIDGKQNWNLKIVPFTNS